MDHHLLRVVISDNGWLEGADLKAWYGPRLPTPFVERTLRLSADDERVVLVIGPRQSGKSTLIWKTLADAGRPAFYLNCEDPSIRGWLVSPGAFLADLAELQLPPEVPLYFEEIQFLAEAGLFLKGLVDRRIGRPIFATGSSSFHLEAATRESLAGRAIRHQLLPLSLAEIEGSLPGPPPLRRLRMVETLEQLLVFGAYPRVFWSADRPRELANLVEAFVVRDASDRFVIRRPDAFRRVLELAASQIGNLCNFSEWASLAAISHDTVVDYCRLLEETHVLRLLRPFVGGKRAELTSSPKVFFVDNGVRNQLFGGFGDPAQRGDRGALVENLAFTELAKHTNPLLDSLWYWRSRSGAEVDFVVRKSGRLLAVEAKAGDARGRITRSARSFVEAYQPEALLIVHQGEKSEERLGDTRVRWLALADLGEALDHVDG